MAMRIFFPTLDRVYTTDENTDTYGYNERGGTSLTKVEDITKDEYGDVVIKHFNGLVEIFSYMPSITTLNP